MSPRKLLAAALVVVTMGAFLSAPAGAQRWPNDPDLIDETEEVIDFDRPEAWAMARLTHVTQMTAMGTDPYAPFPGRLGIDMAFEAFWIPQLSDEQRRVGFNGHYKQNLDWSPVAGRIRLSLRGAAGWFFEVGLVPPLQLGSLQPLFLDGAFGIRLDATEESRVFLRTHGQQGRLRGDIVCPEDLAGEFDNPDNRLNCHSPSLDQMTTATLGLDVGGDYAFGEWRPHVASSVQYLRPEYNLGALYHGDDDNDDVNQREDRRRLATEGVTWTLMGGVTYRPTPNLPLTLEAAYTPLTVNRPDQGEQREGVFNIRLVLRSHIR